MSSSAPAQSSSNRVSKRRIPSRGACKTCRRRKLACDGQRPRCGRCLRHPDAECGYDTGDKDETRTQALKREIDTLQTQLDLFTASMVSLRGLPPGAVDGVLRDALAAPDPMAALVDAVQRVRVQGSLLRSQEEGLREAYGTVPGLWAGEQGATAGFDFMGSYGGVVADQLMWPGRAIAGASRFEEEEDEGGGVDADGEEE